VGDVSRDLSVGSLLVVVVGEATAGVAGVGGGAELECVSGPS